MTTNRNRSKEYSVRVDEIAKRLAEAMAFLMKKSEKDVISYIIKANASEEAYGLAHLTTDNTMGVMPNMDLPRPKGSTVQELYKEKSGQNALKVRMTCNKRPLTRAEIIKYQKSGIIDLGEEFRDRRNVVCADAKNRLYLYYGVYDAEGVRDPKEIVSQMTFPGVTLLEMAVLQKVDNTKAIKDDPASMELIKAWEGRFPGRKMAEMLGRGHSPTNKWRATHATKK